MEQRWTVGCPNKNSLYPWVLYDRGQRVQNFASYGSAYHAMMRLIDGAAKDVVTSDVKPAGG